MNARWAGAILMVLAAVPEVRGGPAAEKPNLAPNPGFEAPADSDKVPPEGWSVFTTRNKTMLVSPEAKRNGSQSAKLTTQGSAGAFQGLTFQIPVTAGTKYAFSVYAINNKADPLGRTASGMLVVEWKDDAGKEISRVQGKPWDKKLSKMRWEEITVTGEAPAGTAKAVFGIHLSEGDKGGQGTCFVDDVSVVAD